MFIKNGSFKKYTHIISYVPPSIIQEPSSGVSKINQTFQFKIKVRGSRPIEYKWYKNDFPIPNSNTDTLTLTSVQYPDQARYYCRVKNNRFGLESSVAELSVLTPPTIVSQPNQVNTELRANVSFNVTITGSPVINYQWYKDGYPYYSDTNSLYINDVAKEDEGNYYVIATNDIGTVTSNYALLSVFDTLDIYKNPTYTIANEHGNTNFYLNYTGSTPVTAQWLKDDVYYGSQIINSSRRVDLNILNVSLSDSGYYNCIVSNMAASVTSLKALLYVNSSVKIIDQPLSATLLANNPYAFTVSVTGTSPISYKWYRNSTELPFSNNKTYFIENVKQINEGTYYCIASNLVNSVTTNFVYLSVIPNIYFTVNLYSQTVDIGDPLTLSVNVIGSLPIYYTWKKEDINLAWSQTNDYYYIDTIDIEDEGRYSVVASNETGSITSFDGYVTVLSDVLYMNDTDYLVLDDNQYMVL